MNWLRALLNALPVRLRLRVCFSLILGERKRKAAPRG
jgi:hypothetical protein